MNYTSRIVPIFSIALAVALFFVYIQPTWNSKVVTAKAQLAKDNQALAAEKTYESEKNNLASEYNAVSQQNLSKISAFLPDSVNNVQMILDLNALAQRSGLTITSIGSSGASTQSRGNTKGNPVNTIEYNLAATGTYSSLEQFLQSLELSERLINVQTLSVQSAQTGVYTYTLTLDAYYLQNS